MTMKTELSKAMDTQDQGRITEDEMAPWIKDELQWHRDMAEKSERTGFIDAIIRVSKIPFIQDKLTPDEILQILNLRK